MESPCSASSKFRISAGQQLRWGRS
jgi:hypothetical protein